MFLQKNKKGFTLIELMVVVAIIGILALLGLRLYSGQQQKAKEAIVKANAGTIQTLIQAELADTAPDDIDVDADIFAKAGIQNPFTNAAQTGSAATAGNVEVTGPTADGVFTIIAHGAGNAVIGQNLTARR